MTRLAQRAPVFAALAILALVLAGCAQPAQPAAGGGANATASDGTGDQPILVRGQLAAYANTSYGSGVWGNASAKNASGRTSYYQVGSCGDRGSFGETLFGPSGAPVDHLGPRPALSCAQGPLSFAPMRPGDCLTWSSNWDGRLWNGTAWTPAPKGTYTWRFGFTYYDRPPDNPSGQGGYGLGASHVATANLTLEPPPYRPAPPPPSGTMSSSASPPPTASSASSSPPPPC